MPQPNDIPPGSDGFARNTSQLATLIGTSRQLLAYHKKLPGSPRPKADGRMDVGAWRAYLAANSRLLMGQGPTADAGPTEADIYAEAKVETLASIGEKLPDLLSFTGLAMRVTLTPEQLDIGTHCFFECMSAALGIEVAEDDTPGPVKEARKRLQAMAPAV